MERNLITVEKISRRIQIDGKDHQLKLERATGGWECLLDGRRVVFEAVSVRRDVLSLRIAGRVYEVKRETSLTGTILWVGHTPYSAEWRDPRSLRGRKRGDADDEGPRKLVAPMPGKVIRVLLPEKAPVEAGQSIVVMEAMKMQNEIKSPRKGTIQKILASEGTNVNAGDVLVIVE
ncbi:MAG: acetyl-CoA carboxylase biotin carboxyl carrier protein subunit [Terriglobales bacterium]